MLHVYVQALTLCRFHSLIITQTFWRALTVLVEIKECPFSGVTSSGTVGRKVSESEIWSVWCYLHTKCKKHRKRAKFNVPVKNMQTN